MSVITDLTEGATKGLFSSIGNLLKDVRNTLGFLDPETKAKLETTLAQIELRTQELQSESEKLTVADRSSARLRESELAKTGNKDYFAKALDILAILAFISILFLFFYKVIPDGTAKDILLILIGTLTGIVKDIYGYYRGSSAGSGDKSNTISLALQALVGKLEKK